MTSVGMVGLGKLGYPVAAAMASRGLHVYGVDPHLQPPNIQGEDQLAETLTAAGDRLKITTLAEAVANCDVLFLAIQTPHGPRFEGVTPLPEDRADFDYSFLTAAVREIREEADRQDRRLTISVISTVLPGTMRREIRPLLDRRVSLCYSPSFIAMGTVIRDFLDPEFVLLGGDDGTVESVYHHVYGARQPRYVKTTVENAELIKVAYNTMIGLKIAYANTLMEVCHKTGTDVDEVTRALKQAHRRLISPAYLTGGMGDGGGCFPPGELVMTEHGPRPIETINPGDRVLAGDGILRPVVRRWERHYDGDLIEVKAQGTLPTRATSDHPFYVAADGRPAAAGRKHHPAFGTIAEHLGPLEQRDAGDLRDDDFVAWPRILEDLTVQVPEHATPEYLELAGWYLAEGSIDAQHAATGAVRSGRVRFDLHANEVQERERIAELLPRVAPPRESGRGAGAKVATTVIENRASVRYGSVALTTRLLADFGKGCATKTLPSWLLWGPLENAALVLRGMIAGDGHISSSGVHYSTTSRDLAYGAFMLVDRFGTPATLRSATRPNRLTQYEVRVRNGPHAVALTAALELPAPSAPQKGAERFPDRADGHFYRRIRRVERIPYSGPVYNLWVDEEHSYVTPAGRVANCHPRDNIALSWLARELGLSFDLFGAAMQAREAQAQWLADLLLEHADGLPLAILGSEFKPGSDSETGSAAVLCANLLRQQGHDVVCFRRTAPPPVQPMAFLVGCRHREFETLEFPAGSVVVDPHRYIPDQEGVEVIRVGEGQAVRASQVGDELPPLADHPELRRAAA